jgi:trehalose 6-phosphate synthase/phosphatase
MDKPRRVWLKGPMSRLILVSNRLPVTVKADGGRVAVAPSAGGLATGLKGPHQRSGGLWLGWPGDVSRLSAAELAEVERRLAELRCVPVHLTASEVSRYYEGFSNRVLWPLFHYLLDQIPLHSRDFQTYRKVNEKFADLVAAHYQEGDLVWVHDYQLLLLPGMLRERLPHARIGFFLHIPFPTSEVFRTLPWRDELLAGMLGADLVGFHTLSYARAFISSLLRVRGVAAQVDRVKVAGREVRVGAFPMGVDARAFEALARDPEVERQVQEIRAQAKGEKILLGVDRLDYTKGIPRRLLAVERLLEREPSLRGKLRLIQVAVPSRTKVDAYEAFRKRVDELVGRINGAYGTLHQVPIHYLYRSFNERQLTAMYRAADVMLITALRDGMNLVAKEFVASRVDEDGVLLLSEFAGAASELGEAVQINPYDVEQMAQAIRQALEMSEEERRLRMLALRRRVAAYDVHRWAESFIETLASAPDREATPRPKMARQAELEALVVKLAQAERLVLLIDYDGTLVNFVGLPELASPGAPLKALLGRLSRAPGTFVHVVSGRKREQLSKWLGELDIGLHGEHGLWSREGPGRQWVQVREVPLDWKEKLRPILEEFTARTPGAVVEEKTASLAWHYRMAELEFGVLQANELYLHLTHLFANEPVELLPGDKVLEVRPHGVNKGLVVPKLEAEVGSGAQWLAVGDDRTDEDMFVALPEGGVAIQVGARPSRAQYWIPDVAAVHALLEQVARARS